MKHTQLLISLVSNGLTVPPPSERSWTKRGKIIDACHTNSYVLHSEVSEPNLTKSLHDVEKWWPIDMLQSKLRYSNYFRTPACRMNNSRQIAVESQRNFHFLARFPRSYWTDLYQTFKQCRRISAAIAPRYCILFRNARPNSEGSQFRRLQKNKTRKAWQSLAYSPFCAVVSPPSEY